MKLTYLVAAALSTMLIASCAKQMPPPGGPEDKTPPEVVTFVPDNGSIFVDLNPVISVMFSERMNRETTAGAVFVSPPVEGIVHIEWKKNELRLSFDEKLRIDRTYLITVGSGATDAHGNRLAQSFTIAFSTGETLDSGSISGIVRSNLQPMAGATVVAYDLAFSDSLNPSTMTPIYITQSGSNGEYSLNHVAPGDYLILAFDDKSRNKKWNPPGEAIGLPSIPALLNTDSRSIGDVNLDLSVRDTTALGVKDAVVSVDGVLRITLSDFCLRSSIDSCRIALVPPNGIDSIRADKAFAWQDSSKEILAPVGVTSVSQDLRLSIRNLIDVWGNEIDTEHDSVFLAVTATADKKKPSAVFSDPRSGDNAVAIDAAIVFRFDEPVSEYPGTSGFKLVGVDSSTIACSSDQPDPFSIRFVPDDDLQPERTYTASLASGSVTDFSGNRGPDSVSLIKFTTLGSDTLGVFSGQFRLNGAQMAQNPRLFTKSLPKGEWRKISFDTGGKFTFEGTPGQYILTGFFDRDGDGFRSPGRLSRFEYAEPYIIITDTLTIRSRFETENVEIDIE